jgi:glyoxylase-like metal-dependent hydrolase (beta-lactamase superfamily II)
VTFDHVAVVDLPYLRERAVDNTLSLTWAEHLGSAEGISRPTLHVDEWLLPNSIMSLGDRQLRVLYTPGHTEDSISLLDTGTGVLFSGDFIYPGPLYAFLPNSGMGDYLQGTDTVLTAAPEQTRIFGAHRIAPPGAPELSISDVQDLQTALQEIESGQRHARGVYPREYPVNEQIQLLAEPRWLQNWQVNHP